MNTGMQVDRARSQHNARNPLVVEHPFTNLSLAQLAAEGWSPAQVLELYKNVFGHSEAISEPLRLHATNATQNVSTSHANNGESSTQARQPPHPSQSAETRCPCPYCSRPVKTRGALEHHFNNECDPIGQWKCAHCDSKFQRRDKAKEHQDKCCHRGTNNSGTPPLYVRIPANEARHFRVCGYCGHYFIGDTRKPFSKHLIDHCGSGQKDLTCWSHVRVLLVLLHLRGEETRWYHERLEHFFKLCPNQFYYYEGDLQPLTTVINGLERRQDLSSLQPQIDEIMRQGQEQHNQRTCYTCLGLDDNPMIMQHDGNQTLGLDHGPMNISHDLQPAPQPWEDQFQIADHSIQFQTADNSKDPLSSNHVRDVTKFAGSSFEPQQDIADQFYRQESDLSSTQSGPTNHNVLTPAGSFVSQSSSGDISDRNPLLLSQATPVHTLPLPPLFARLGGHGPRSLSGRMRNMREFLNSLSQRVRPHQSLDDATEAG